MTETEHFAEATCHEFCWQKPETHLRMSHLGSLSCRRQKAGLCVRRGSVVLFARAIFRYNQSKGKEGT